MINKAALASLILVVFTVGCGNKKGGTPNIPLAAKPASAVSAGASTKEEALPLPAGVDLVIREKMFIAQVNDVYQNRNDYLGKTIKLEGLFKQGQYGENTFCYVIRNGPGCCGDDGQVGFEVYWNEPAVVSAEEQESYPKVDDWVEAQGVLRRYVMDGSGYLYLDLTELNVLEKRGAEFVIQ